VVGFALDHIQKDKILDAGVTCLYSEKENLRMTIKKNIFLSDITNQFKLSLFI